MEGIYELRNGKVDAPHRHDYYTVLIVKKANGKHFIDFKEFALQNNQVYFISPGQVHQVVEFKKSYGYSLVFSSEFLAKNNIETTFIDDLNLFNDFGNSPPLNLSDTELKKVCAYADEISKKNSENSTYKYQAIGALLKLILIECNNLCSLPKIEIQHLDAAGSILKNYKKMIEANYKNWHGTQQYAKALHISPDYLNKVVKSLTGKTAKEHLQNRITIAAKRLLYFTNFTTKEIAYELGFSEPANFSTFFKKCTGLSPTNFKK